MIRQARDYYTFNTIAYVVVGSLALFALLPFLILATNSFSSEHAIITRATRSCRGSSPSTPTG